MIGIGACLTFKKYKIANNSNAVAINEWEHILALWSHNLKTKD